MTEPLKSELAFEEFSGESPPPSLWRVCSKRYRPGASGDLDHAIRHTNWFATEDAARKHAKWINDGRGQVISVTRYVKTEE